MKLINSVFLCCLFLFFSCNKGSVSLVSVTPTGEVEPFSTFEFVFDNDIGPADSLDKWLGKSYVEFEPEIAGKFKWIAPNILIFSPNGALNPSTEYSYQLKEGMISKDGVKIEVEDDGFHTPFFDATEAEFFWTGIPHSNFKVSTKANLKFNYEVSPEDLRDKLEIAENGKKITDFKIENTTSSKNHAISFGERQQSESAVKYLITIKKGLKASAISIPLSEDRVFDYTLPPIQKLAITNVSSGFDGKAGWIEISTTQEVDKSKIRKYISTNPVKKLDVTVNQSNFRIIGEFEPGTMVDLTIKKGMPGLFGGTLSSEYSASMVMADLDPDVKFVDRSGKYLMRSGLKNIELFTTNVPNLDVQVYEVFANNLLFFNNNNHNNYYDDYYDDYGYGYHVGNYGKLIHEETISSTDQRNNQNRTFINLEEHFSQRFKGVFVVKVMDKDNRWRYDSKVISLSDIGLIVKKTPTGIMVFANSIVSTEPMEGVEINLISNNNQTLATAKTDASGVINWDNLETIAEGFTPKMITAVSGEDFNFLDLNQTLVETSRFDLGGKTEYHPDYETFIYSDRNLFRPGEKVNFSAIVRDKSIGVVPNLPVVFEIVGPRGRKLKTFNIDLNSQGSFEQQYSISEAAQTGEYRANLYTGDKKTMGNIGFAVEEFVPDKIRVFAEGDKPSISPEQSQELTFNSEYLFGSPNKGAKFEVDVSLSHRVYRSKKYSSYNFNSSRTDGYLPQFLESGTLDDKGKGSLTFSPAKDLTSKGYISANAFVAVFDATGRTVTRSVPFKITPNNHFIGVKRDRYYYDSRSQIELGIVAVDIEDNDLKNFSAEVEVVKHEWRSVLRRKGNSGRYRYVSEREERVVIPKKGITLNGEYQYSLKVPESGSYELRVYKSGSSKYTSQRFYAYGWGRSTASSFKVDKEGRVEITLDKDTYEVGETAKVLFTTPFSGRLLVTVERENVMEYRNLNITNNSAEMELKIDENFMPNAFISATLFKKMEVNSPSPFTVGHGYKSFLAQKKSTILPVEIIAQEKVKPNTSQEITIKTVAEKDVMVTLALVDEGILQIKNYKTPNPHGFMYAKRRLKVTSHDLYKFLLPEVESFSSSPAGGDESESAKRANPIKANRFKLLSKWSGIRKTNSNGEVTVKIDLPQFNGEARLMVVAYEGNRFGSGQKAMKIADDVVMMPAIPRVFSTGDSVQIPISLMNTTDKAGSMNVSIELEGPLKLSSSGSQKIKLGAKESKTAYFGIMASNIPGKAKIKLKGTGLDNVSQNIEIAVRPINPLTVETDGGFLEGNITKEVVIPGGFIPESQYTTLVISKFPGIQMLNQLKYLVGYPHGCLEQTTSRSFPQLYLADIAGAVGKDKYFGFKGSPTYYVNEGINKVQGYLRSDGSFSYWPGSSYYNWWGSTYATHFLVEAQKAGYNVSESVLNKSLSYVQRMVANKTTHNYSYWTNGAWVKKPRAPREVIYGLYVLALAGKGDLALMNYFRARPHLLTGDTKYLLAGAFGLMNKWKGFNELMADTFTPTKAKRNTGGSFYSEVQANAIMLNVLMEVDPSNKQVPYLVKYLTNVVKSRGNTQDFAWVLMALGKAAKSNAGTDMKVDVIAKNKTLSSFTGKTMSYSSDQLHSGFTLKTSGKGKVYYFWASEGVKGGEQSFASDVDERLKVRRTFLDREGSVITGNSFRQGDLVICKVSLTGIGQSAENVAISDLIPAGFEIENPRLSTSTSINWIKDQSTPQYSDFKDDRVLLFTNSYAGSTQNYYYLLRAVNAGKFMLPPIGAEAMYDPEFHSFNGGRVVNIIPQNTEGS